MVECRVIPVTHMQPHKSFYGSLLQLHEMRRPFQKEISRGPFGASVLPTKRERQLCLPPPFEKLCEEEDTMLSSFKEEEEDGAVETPTMEAFSDSDNTFLEPDLVNVGERRRRASVDKEITLEVSCESSSLLQKQLKLSSWYSSSSALGLPGIACVIQELL